MKKRVLVTATGGGVAHSVIKSLQMSDFDFRIIGTDMRGKTAYSKKCRKHYIVPRCDEKGYIEKIKKICEEEAIDFVIPGSSPEVDVFSERKHELDSEVIAFSRLDSVNLIDKFSSCKLLAENDVPIAETFESLDESLEDNEKVVAKKRKGSGSTGVFVLRNEFERKAFRSSVETSDYIFQEFLEPNEERLEEYSSGVNIDNQGNIVGALTAKCHKKKGTSITMEGVFDRYPAYDSVAEKAGNVLAEMGYVGSVNIQMREKKIFEINPRFSGSTCARSKAGLNGPVLTLKTLQGRELSEPNLRYGLRYERSLSETYFMEADDVKEI